MSINSQDSQDTFYSPAEGWVVPAPSFDETRRETIRDRLWASMHMSSKKRLEFRRVGDSQEIFIFSSLCSCSKILLLCCLLANFAKSTVTLAIAKEGEPYSTELEQSCIGATRAKLARVHSDPVCFTKGIILTKERMWKIIAACKSFKDEISFSNDLKIGHEIGAPL